jgi:hypothetical protein
VSANASAATNAGGVDTSGGAHAVVTGDVAHNTPHTVLG